MDRNQQLADIKRRQDVFWTMAETFVQQRDAHGVMDMGAELQALDRAYREVEKAA